VLEFALPIRIYIEDTDAGGIVYYVNYLKYFERARTELIRSMGVDKTAVMEDGSVFVVTSASIDYLLSARLDDEVIAHAKVIAAGGASIVFEQAVLRGEQVLARGQVTAALTDGQTGKPKRMPIELRKVLKGALLPKEVTDDRLTQCNRVNSGGELHGQARDGHSGGRVSDILVHDCAAGHHFASCGCRAPRF